MSLGTLSTWDSPSSSKYVDSVKSTSSDRPALKTTLCIGSDSNGQFLLVSCGSVEGNFYPAKFKKGLPSSKCIWYNSNWCSLIEFEGFGGRSKSRNWKRTLKHNNVSLGSILEENPELLENVTLSQHLSQAKSSLPSLSSSLLCNPVLAYVNAFRLKGDVSSLRQALSEGFSVSEIDDALKCFWDYSHSELESSGFVYRHRRGSEKSPVLELVMDDLLVAFDKLDTNDQIPPIYCESVDLLKLPSLNFDFPTSTVQESNMRIRDLQSSMQASNGQMKDLHSNVVNITDDLATQASSLNQLKESINDQLKVISNTLHDNLTSAIHSVSSEVSSLKEQINKARLSNSSTSSVCNSSSTNTTLNKQSKLVDRSSNVIFFGIPESDLLETRSIVDEICYFVSGKEIVVKDLFRLGKKVSRTDNNVQVRPRPILVKFSTVWDKRLILISKKKLKEFRLQNVFVRPDLSPEERAVIRNRKTTKVSSVPNCSTSKSNEAVVISVSSDNPVLPALPHDSITPATDENSVLSDSITSSSFIHNSSAALHGQVKDSAKVFGSTING